MAFLAVSAGIIPATATKNAKELPNGCYPITAIQTPPGFDPLTASAADLARYGFPPRPQPSDPAYTLWQQGYQPGFYKPDRHAMACPITDGRHTNLIGSSGSSTVPTRWHLDPGSATPGPSTRVLQVLAADMACAGGRSQDSLVKGATVSYRSKEVDIRFDAVSLSGAYKCIGSIPPWVRRTVVLTQELGNRRLVDLGEGPGHVRYPTDDCTPDEILSGC
jgi:hypothetical protein